MIGFFDRFTAFLFPLIELHKERVKKTDVDNFKCLAISRVVLSSMSAFLIMVLKVFEKYVQFKQIVKLNKKLLEFVFRRVYLSREKCDGIIRQLEVL